MKNILSVVNIAYLPKGQKLNKYEITFQLRGGSTGINYVIGSLDEKYLSYYVKGVERVISGELEYMYIDGSEELEDWESLEVRRDKVRSQMLGEREQEIGTEDFLEILKIMKREYGVGDEVVVDPRSERVVALPKPRGWRFPWQV